jgi:hypothetical protein
MRKSYGDHCGQIKRTKIAFVCFNATFFLSHFLPAVDAARASGFEIFAILPSVWTDAASLRDVKVVRVNSGRSRHPIWRLP